MTMFSKRIVFLKKPVFIPPYCKFKAMMRESRNWQAVGTTYFKNKRILKSSVKYGLGTRFANKVLADRCKRTPKKVIFYGISPKKMYQHDSIICLK